MSAERIAAAVAKFPMPDPKDGKLAGVDKRACDEALAELTQLGPAAASGLVELIAQPGRTGSQARHALHALTTHHAGGKETAARAAFSAALAKTLGSDLPKDVQAFIVRQLQLIGGREAAPALGRLLLDEALADDVAMALVAVKEGAAEPLRAALPKAKGKVRVAIVQALGTIHDAGAAAALRPLLADADRDVRLAAGGALARIGDAASIDPLLKAAEAEGYERIKATQASLLLAETLTTAGRKTDAARIYRRLNETRTDPKEQHIRDAAARGLATVG